MFFRTTPSNSSQAKKLSNYIKSKKFRKIVIFTSKDSAYSREIEVNLKKHLIEPLIDIVDLYDLSYPNSNPALELAHIAYQKKADAAIILPNLTNKNLALELIKANGQLPKENQISLVGNDILYSSDILTISGNGIEKLTIVSPRFYESQDFYKSDNNSFIRKAYELWGDEISWRTATSYDATKLLTNSLKPKISRSKILKYLHSVKLSPEQTSGRYISFTSDGNIREEPLLLKTTKCEYPKTVYCFMPNDTK